MNDPRFNKQLDRLFARLAAKQAQLDAKIAHAESTGDNVVDIDIAHEMHAITACEQAIDRWYDSHSPSEVLP